MTTAEREVTKAELDAAVNEILQDIHELDTRMSGHLGKVEDRLGKVENSLDKVVEILGDIAKALEDVPKLYKLHLMERHGVNLKE